MYKRPYYAQSPAFQKVQMTPSHQNGNPPEWSPGTSLLLLKTDLLWVLDMGPYLFWLHNLWSQDFSQQNWQWAQHPVQNKAPLTAWDNLHRHPVPNRSIHMGYGSGHRALLHTHQPLLCQILQRTEILPTAHFLKPRAHSSPLYRWPVPLCEAAASIPP